MQTKLLLDTDVIIDYLRGNESAIDYFETIVKAKLLISAISIAELYPGVRGEHEEEVLSAFLGQFEVINIDHQIAVVGGFYKRDFQKKHGTGLADAIIVACATEHGATLVTLNEKHFKMLPNLIVPYRK